MSICVELTRDRDAAGRFAASPAAAAAGGKARSLLRLAEAGLPVPAAFVVTDLLFRRLRAGAAPLPPALRDAADLAALDQARDALLAAPWPTDLAAELDGHLERLAPGDASARYSVRSSFLREDRAQAMGAGAGVYDSVIGVGRPDVAAAVRRVLASALSPGAVAYALARGEDPEAQATAVLIHRTIDGQAAGSAAFDPVAGEPPAVEVTTGTLDPVGRAAATRALQALASRHGPVEVEWVSDAGALTFLQLRPYVAPRAARAWAPAAALGAGDWRWDAAHNPLPLSPAQAGLVAIVDARCRIGLRQRVAGGYLFHAPDGPAATETLAPPAIADAFAALGATVDAGLTALTALTAPRPALEESLALFVSTYDRLYGVIQPALRRATRALVDLLRAHAIDDVASLPGLLAGVPSLAAERLRAARRLSRAHTDEARDAALAEYLARFGDEAPIWDVAVPTHREAPARLLRLREPPGGETAEASPIPDWREAAREVAARLPVTAAAAFAALLERARVATAIGEDDDGLYARVQGAVRAALRREGSRLVDAGLLTDADDVFWLPLDLVRQLARDQASQVSQVSRASQVSQASQVSDDRAALARDVAAARAAHQRALQEPPAGPTGHDQARTGRAPGALIPGRRASAGRVIGPAFVHRPHRSPGTGDAAGGVAVPSGASIVVAATLLPSELPLLQAAGLVVESGGVLGHVAAQARERGIPALVDAHGACAMIADGDLLLLDADGGQVIVLRLG